MTEITPLNVLVVDKLGHQHVYGEAGSGLRKNARSFGSVSSGNCLIVTIYDGPNQTGNVIAVFHDPTRVEVYG